MSLNQEVETIQKTRTPAASRIWGNTRAVLKFLGQGPALRSDVRESMLSPPGTLDSALHALVKYRLVGRDQEGYYFLTETGRRYCDILSGRLRQIVREEPNVEDKPGQEELSGQPDPLASATTTGSQTTLAQFLPQDQARSDVQYRTRYEYVLNLPLTCTEHVLNLTSTLPDYDSLYGRLDTPPTNDPAKNHVESVPWSRSSSTPPPRKHFVPFSDSEKNRIMAKVRELKQENNWSEAESTIVGMVLAACCFREYHPWNQKVFSTKEEALEFFDLPTQDFDRAMARLEDQRIAYFYKGADKKKVGLLVNWLDLASGRARN